MFGHCCWYYYWNLVVVDNCNEDLALFQVACNFVMLSAKVNFFTFCFQETLLYEIQLLMFYFTLVNFILETLVLVGEGDGMFEIEVIELLMLLFILIIRSWARRFYFVKSSWIVTVSLLRLLLLFDCYGKLLNLFNLLIFHGLLKGSFAL